PLFGNFEERDGLEVHAEILARPREAVRIDARAKSQREVAGNLRHFHAARRHRIDAVDVEDRLAIDNLDFDLLDIRTHPGRQRARLYPVEEIAVLGTGAVKTPLVRDR